MRLCSLVVLAVHTCYSIDLSWQDLKETVTDSLNDIDWDELGIRGAAKKALIEFDASWGSLAKTITAEMKKTNFDGVAAVTAQMGKVNFDGVAAALDKIDWDAMGAKAKAAYEQAKSDYDPATNQVNWAAVKKQALAAYEYAKGMAAKSKTGGPGMASWDRATVGTFLLVGAFVVIVQISYVRAKGFRDNVML